MESKIKKSIELLKVTHPHHDWICRDFLIMCAVCGMSALTPQGKCKPWRSLETDRK